MSAAKKHHTEITSSLNKSLVMINESNNKTPIKRISATEEEIGGTIIGSKYSKPKIG
jgi:hypothetical protein